MAINKPPRPARGGRSGRGAPPAPPASGTGGTGRGDGGSIYTDRKDIGDLLELPLEDLCPNPFNKRQMKGIPELASGIAKLGLLQSIAHIPAEDWIREYPETADQITAPQVILFGEHRWRAMQHLGMPTISSVLRVDLVAEARLVWSSRHRWPPDWTALRHKVRSATSPLVSFTIGSAASIITVSITAPPEPAPGPP